MTSSIPSAEITTDNSNRYRDIAATAASIAGAGAAGTATTLAIGKWCQKPLVKHAQNCIKATQEMNSVFKDGAIRALESEGIKYAHIEDIVDLIFDDDFLEFATKNKPNKLKIALSKMEGFAKKIFKLSNKNFSEKVVDVAAEGTNAFCLKGKVFTNFDKASALSFHEMGHAKNFNGRGLGKVLSILRNPTLRKAGIVIAAASAILLPPVKENDSETDKKPNFLTKTQRFLKKNCVGIAALSFAPQIMEEGLASIKGGQIAKKFLDPNACKTVNQINLKAFGTYLLTGAAFTLGVYAAKKVRDTISEKLSA